MRVLWWLVLPCVYFLFCLGLMWVLRWATEGETTFVDESVPEDIQ